MIASGIPVSVAEQRAGYGLSRATLSPVHQNYLAGRGIANAARAIGARTTTALHSKAPAIWLPYGGPNGKTYEVGSESPWRQVKPKNTRLPLFQLERVDFARPWILTEGEFDMLAGYEVGWTNITSLPDGAVQPNEETPAQSGKLWAIRDAWPRIQAGGGPVTLALDNDIAGDATRDALIDIFGRWRCRVIDWPVHAYATGADGKCKDLNEVLQLLGPDELRRILHEARPLKLEGVYRASEIKKRPPRKYYDSGLPGMDAHLKLFPGELCIWTGHTSHGKTTSLFNVLGNLAEQGLKIGVGAFEADYWEDILPWYDAWRNEGEVSVDTEAATHQWLDENFIFISHEIEPLKSPATIEWVIQQGQDAKGRFGIDVLVIDPWNKLQHRRGKFENESDYIGRALAELRNFAQTYSVIVIVLAHPTKDTGKDGEIPNEYDIHGSANWANMPDHIVITYRPSKEKTATLFRVTKSRYRKGGRPGDKWMTFSESKNRYSLMAEHMIAEFRDKPKAEKKRFG